MATEEEADELFLNELREAVYTDGVQIKRIADQFGLSEEMIEDWLRGADLPERSLQLKIFSWLETIDD